MRGGRQSYPEHCRETVGRNDIETDSRQQGDPALLRRFVQPGRRLDHVDLAGDVQVVPAGRDAGIDHRRRGLRERARTVEHRADIGQRLERFRGRAAAERKRTGFAAQLRSQPLDRFAIPAGQHRPQTQLNRPPRNEFPRIPIRAVEEESCCHIGGRESFLYQDREQRLCLDKRLPTGCCSISPGFALHGLAVESGPIYRMRAMDESVYTSSPAYSVEDSGEPTFWEGLTVVALLVFGVATIVRGLSDPLSATYFYASVFRAVGGLTLLGWGVAASLVRGVRSVAVPQ